jgi:hypothetical protein
MPGSGYHQFVDHLTPPPLGGPFCPRDPLSRMDPVPISAYNVPILMILGVFNDAESIYDTSEVTGSGYHQFSYTMTPLWEPFLSRDPPGLTQCLSPLIMNQFS